MTEDLYKVLGVSRTAKPETITRAFRWMSMRHHPDRGGDREKFERVVFAHEVLSDPIRRARYDETGEADAGPDNSAIQGMEQVVACLHHVLQEAESTGRDSTKHDLVQLMRNTFNSKRAEVDTARRKLERDIAKIENLLGRFQVDGKGDNFLEAAVNQRLRGFKESLCRVEADLAQLDAGIKYLEKCSFRFDKADNPPPRNTKELIELARLGLPGTVVFNS